MSPRLAALALVLCTCGLAACGGGSKPAPGDAVQGYIDAIAAGAGHGAQVCGYLTGPALRLHGGSACPAKVDHAAGSVNKTALAEIKKLKFTVVGVHGNYATVRVSVPSATCPAGQKQNIRLVKQDGNWKINQTDDTVCAPGF